MARRHLGAILVTVAVGCGDGRGATAPPPARPPPARLAEKIAETAAPTPSAEAPAPTATPSATDTTVEPDAPAPRPAVEVELTMDRQRQVSARFGGPGVETLQRFVLRLKTEPPQTLFIGNLRQTMCSLTRPVDAIVGIGCYTNAVGFNLWLEPAVRGVSRVMASEGLESGRVLRRWSPGVVRLPDGHDLHLTIRDGTRDAILETGVLERDGRVP